MIMKVKDLILYQVATDRFYKVGDKLEFGKEYNGQGRRVVFGENLSSGRVYDDGYKYVNKKLKLFPQNSLVLKLSKQLEEYDFVMRELAFESVRKAGFVNCPSRLKCMFLTDDKKACVNNLKTFCQRGFGKFFQAVAVKVTGNVFYSYSKDVKRLGCSISDYSEMAKNYWSQEQKMDLPVTEILFEGKAEVVEIIEEYTRQN